MGVYKVLVLFSEHFIKQLKALWRLVGQLLYLVSSNLYTLLLQTQQLLSLPTHPRRLLQHRRSQMDQLHLSAYRLRYVKRTHSSLFSLCLFLKNKHFINAIVKKN